MISKVVRILILTALVATCLLSAAPVRAQEPEPYYLFTFGGEPAYPQTGQPILLVWGWLAYTRGQNIELIKADIASYRLVNADGDLVWSLTSDQAKAYWGEPVKLDALSCCQVVTPNGSIWNSVWEYPLGSLEAGTYTLISIDNITHTVNDGYHTFRDPVTGEPITPAPSIYHPGDPYEVHTTIVVQ